MNDQNLLVFHGRLTRDAELKQFENGSTVCNFPVACNYNYKKGEEWVEETVFLDAAKWGLAAESLTPRLTMGTTVQLTGRLKMDTWEKDGVKRQRYSIVVSTIGVAPKNKTDEDVPFDN